MDTVRPGLKKKLSLLQDMLHKTERVSVAFSGGVDSSFLLRAAVDTLGDNCLALIADGDMLPRRELNNAMLTAGSLNARLITVPVRIFELPGFYENSPLRCYYCKKHIFTALKNESEKQGFELLADGTNLDDMHDDRPGLKALRELRVISPLADAGLTKDDIRLLSGVYGLRTANKPSMACLATRVPHGTAITQEALRIVEAGEDILEKLGLGQYRLRLDGNNARIECGPDDFNKIISNRKGLTASLKQLGLSGITLDLRAYGEK